MDEQSLLDVLQNETSRAILQYTSETERSAEELAELVGVTQTTIYRKLERLREEEFIHERIHIDGDGNHYREYLAAIDHVEVDIAEDDLQIEVGRNEGPADTFTRMWEDIRGDR